VRGAFGDEGVRHAFVNFHWFSIKKRGRAPHCGSVQIRLIGKVGAVVRHCLPISPDSTGRSPSARAGRRR
jgi:hypothetical protein